MNAPTSPTPPSEAEPIAAEAGIGHNKPPAFDATVVTDLETTVSEFMSVTQQWLQLEKIENDHHAEQVNDQITGLRGLFKNVDDARKAAKKPHDDAGKVVQAAFSPILAKLKAAAEALKPKMAIYTQAKAAAEAEEKRKAEAEARAKAEEAAAAAKAAEEDGDIAAKVEAEEAQKAAEKQVKVAAKGPGTKVKSASGGGRTMSMRTEKTIKITNINVLFMELCDEPEVHETLARIATRMVRAKDYAERKPLPGIKIIETKKMA